MAERGDSNQSEQSLGAPPIVNAVEDASLCGSAVVVKPYLYAALKSPVALKLPGSRVAVR